MKSVIERRVTTLQFLQVFADSLFERLSITREVRCHSIVERERPCVEVYPRNVHEALGDTLLNCGDDRRSLFLV